ncbi:MAG: GNAT family N-acetyltransferase [Anaerolineae bacterium]|nr:GNAT family N-acetyltransferase [Anaerolineae bacterium]
MEPRISIVEWLIVVCLVGFYAAAAAAIVLWWRQRDRRRQVELADVREWQRDNFRITTDTTAMDLDAIHAMLTRAYWSPGIDRETVQRAMRHSLCFGMFDGTRQIGYLRYATDRTRFAYLMDVYVLEEYRGQGLGVWLVGSSLEHPDISRCRRLLLTTRDAHDLYRKFDFTELPHPEHWMERFRESSASQS